MSLPAPRDLLPHRPPFLFVDGLRRLDPGRAAVGYWTVDASEPFFGGHFPDMPVVPGVLQIEALAQLGAAAVLADERFAGRLPLLAGVERSRFRRPVRPGETLELQIDLERLSARGGRGSGRATVDDEVTAEGRLLFVLADAPEV